MKSLAFLLDSAPVIWSSVEDRHEATCRSLVARHITPVLIFVRALPSEMEARLTAAGAKVEFIRYERGVLYYYRHLRRLAAKYNLEVAHISYFDYFSPVAWIAWLAGIRTIIYEMQNSGVLRATGPKRALIRFRTWLATLPVRHVIAISESVKEQLVLVGFKPDQVSVRYLGVDTERFSPDPDERRKWRAEHGVGEDELVLCTVAYLRRFKHPEVIVEACAGLAKRGLACRMFFGGDGDLLDEMRTLAQSLGIGDRVHFLGRLKEPRALMRASDLFLLTSIGEAFGLVLAEAMACGAAVVGVRSGAIPEIVVDGDCGLLVPPMDAAALTDAVFRLATDRELLHKMSQNAVHRVTDCFTVERLVGETLRVYDRLRI